MSKKINNRPYLTKNDLEKIDDKHTQKIIDIIGKEIFIAIECIPIQVEYYRHLTHAYYRHEIDKRMAVARIKEKIRKEALKKINQSKIDEASKMFAKALLYEKLTFC